jgi:ATP-dependent Clp protease ATP-binding subunit ClpA
MRQFPDKAIDILDLAAALQTTHPVAPPDAGKNTAPASPAVAGGTAA